MRTEEQKQKERERKKRYFAEHPEQASAKKFKFKITAEEYQDRVDVQQGHCAICGNEETNGKRLAIDHNHETKQVRGLLCHRCNVALGGFNDDDNLLELALEYLRFWKSQQ